MIDWLIRGAMTVHGWIAPFASIGLTVAILILLPMAIFRKTRIIAGSGFLIWSYVVGATIWFWSAAIALILWGIWGLVIGFFLAGVGVVPIAFVAGLFAGQWSIPLWILGSVAVVFSTRYFAFRLMDSD